MSNAQHVHSTSFDSSTTLQVSKVPGLESVLGAVLSNPNIMVGLVCTTITGDGASCLENRVCCTQAVTVNLFFILYRLRYLITGQLVPAERIAMGYDRHQLPPGRPLAKRYQLIAVE